jgi:hypothetical protein
VMTGAFEMTPNTRLNQGLGLGVESLISTDSTMPGPESNRGAKGALGERKPSRCRGAVTLRHRCLQAAAG